MKDFTRFLLFIFIITGCRNVTSSHNLKFPPEITNFKAVKGNPVFAGTGTDTWDQKIRERGYILREDGIYYLWYTGYNGGEEVEKHLGLATSPMA